MEYADIDIDDIIIRLFNGCATAADTMRLARWLEASDDNRRYFESQQREWNMPGGGDASTSYDASAAYGRMEARIGRDMPRRRWSVVGAALRKYGRAVAGVAAAVLLVMGVWMAYDRYVTDYAARFAGMVNVEAPAGSRAKVVLPDGTAVWLNAGSRISYAQGFGVTDRRVRIDGEGYFEVGRKSGLPMSVYSDNISVRDIGTKFNFRDYPEEPTAEVTLCEGEVGVTSLKRPGHETVIRPEQMTLVDKRTGRITTTSCLSADKRLWTAGEMVMDGMTIRQIVNIIERAYKVRIVIASERVNHLQLCGTLNLDRENLNEILDVIAKVGGIGYSVNGRTVRLK